MKRFIILLAAILFLASSKALFAQALLPQGFKAQATNAIAFEENKGQVWDYKGQTHNEVKYVFKQGGTQLFLMESGIAYQFSKINYPEGYKELKAKWKMKTTKEKEELLSKKLNVETFRMDMTLVGANTDAQITTEGKSPDYVNYYNRNAFDVHNYNKLIYHNVYPGIDWVIYKNEEKIKYDFVVSPGADPSLIKMEFTYQDDLSLNKDGSFTLKNSMGTITEKAPVSFQGDKKFSTSFVLKKNVVSFRVENYNEQQTLIIDPALSWGTYYGDNDEDFGSSCATDASGNVYLAGNTQSGSNIASGGHQNNYLGNTDGFLVKFNSGGARQWATYYGGTGQDEGSSCATDGSGNVYLSGLTSSNLGISSGGHQNSFGGGSLDAFLVKFNSGGIRQWATYYGGSSDDYGYGLTTDASGNVYLAGTTDSPNGVATAGAVYPSLSGYSDAFLVKFNSNGTRQWGTYYGDIDYDYGYSTVTDASGNVYLGGGTKSGSGIAFNGHQNSLGGAEDAFLAKFNGAGALQWGTYYGDFGYEEGYSLTTDASGNVYLSGYTESTSGITFNGYQNTFGGGIDDAFLVKFNASGVRQWATYYGGNSDEEGYSCVTDASGNVYLAGRTGSLNDIASGGYQITWGGMYDGFLAKFNGSGIRQWGTYYGGSDDDYATSCATNSSGDVFLAGATSSSMSIASGGFQNTPGGYHDAFLAKFINCTSPPAVSAINGSSLACYGGSTYSVNPDPNISAFAWFFDGGVLISSGNTATILPNTNYGILNVAASGTCGFGPSSTMTVFVNASPVISVNSSEPVFCTGMTTTLSASGANTYTWTGGGNGSTYAVSPNGVAVYIVTGTANNCNGTATYTVVPNTNTAYNYTLSGMSLTLAINSSNCSSFQWDYGNGGGSTINPNPVVTYQNAGTYGVCLKCTALPNGCVRCINITVPGNMTGGVGIAEVENNKSLQIYPNPSNGEFFIESQTEMQIGLYNSLGQLILQKQLETGKNKVDLTKEAKGIYFIKMNDAAGTKAITLVKE